jgi:hypothetical protein
MSAPPVITRPCVVCALPIADGALRYSDGIYDWHLTCDGDRYKGVIVTPKTEVHHEPDDLKFCPPENCVKCKQPTRYWLDPHTPLCQNCALNFAPAILER